MCCESGTAARLSVSSSSIVYLPPSNTAALASRQVGPRHFVCQHRTVPASLSQDKAHNSRISNPGILVLGAACTITWGSRLTPRAEGEGGGGGPVWRGLGMMAGGQPSLLASVPTSEYTSSRTTFCDTLHRHQHQNQRRRHPRPVHDGSKRPFNSIFILGTSMFWRSFKLVLSNLKGLRYYGLLA